MMIFSLWHRGWTIRCRLEYDRADILYFLFYPVWFGPQRPSCKPCQTFTRDWRVAQTEGTAAVDYNITLEPLSRATNWCIAAFSLERCP